MPKPPPTPPSSDIAGVDRDMLLRNHPKVFDAKAQAQLEAENRENVGRPDQDRADDPSDGVGN
jgi:hypothetical protein